MKVSELIAEGKVVSNPLNDKALKILKKKLSMEDIDKILLLTGQPTWAEYTTDKKIKNKAIKLVKAGLTDEGMVGLKLKLLYSETYKEIASLMGVSSTRAQYICTTAINKVKHPRIGKRIRDMIFIDIE